MTEKLMLANMRKAFRKYGDIMQVHNIYTPGIWDTNFCCDGNEMWIEGKYLPKAPVREKTPVRVPHFTAQQRAWGKRRMYHGGNCFVLIGIETDFILLDGETAITRLGRDLTLTQMSEIALGRWTHPIPYLGMRNALVTNCG